MAATLDAAAEAELEAATIRAAAAPLLRSAPKAAAAPPATTFQEEGSSGSGIQMVKQQVQAELQARDEHMQAKEEIAGGTKNKAVLQNATAAKRILTDETASM